MQGNHHAVHCAVYAILISDKKILLSLRKNTGWMDGCYGLPSGHVEESETLKSALVREVKEEIGLDIDETTLTFYHVMHRNKKAVGDRDHVDFYFKVEYWTGEPINTEPTKCDSIQWFDLDDLPDNIVPNVKVAMQYYRSKLIFSEFN